MATAKQPGGFYYMGDQAVDADGKKIEGAGKPEKDTPPEQQPHGTPASPGTMTMRLDDASIAALRGEPAPKAPAAPRASGEAKRTTNTSGTTTAADSGGSGTEQ